MPDILKEMEKHFRHQGVSGVKAHNAAKTLTNAMGARAFTAGEAVAFASYANDSKTSTVGHELAHVIQQGQSKVAKSTNTAEAVAVNFKHAPGAPVKVGWEPKNGGGEKTVEWTYSENPSASEVRKAVDTLLGESQPSGI